MNTETFAQPEITVTKDLAETVYIRHPKSSYGIFCYNSLGDLFLNSDYGMYGYAWRSYGHGGFKQFLSSLNVDYLIGKLETNYMQAHRKSIPKFCIPHLKNLIEAFINSLKEPNIQ